MFDFSLLRYHRNFAQDRATRFWRSNFCSLVLCGAAALTVVALPTTTHAQLPASINLANELDGTNGFVIDSFSLGSYIAVGGAGDINGDGIDDLVVSGGGIVFGRADGFNAVIDESVLNGTDGFAIKSNGFGTPDTAVSSAGDVNGDGIDDLIIGTSDIQSTNYVVFGNTNGFSATLDVATLDGTNGFTINGGDVGNPMPPVLGGLTTRVNSSVSGAGDFNGDGIDDLIIGDRFSNPTGTDSSTGYTLSTGASYVVFGDAGGFNAAVDLTTLDGTDGVVFNGPHDFAETGQSVSSAGDFNGDGIDDVVIGAPGSNESYVVYGDINGFNSPLDPSMLDGTNGFQIEGIDVGQFSLGSTVSGAGDINGDGLDDLILGDFEFDSPVDITDPSIQASYVVFGSEDDFGGVFNIDTLDGTNGFQIRGLLDGFGMGRSLSEAGDVNGDGFDDLIVSRISSAFVVYGGADGFDAIVDINGLDGTNGFTIAGAGDSVSNAGDINGDGVDDLILSSGVGGQAHVVFGAVPEPSSMWLVFGGLLGWTGSRRRAN